MNKIRIVLKKFSIDITGARKGDIYIGNSGSKLNGLLSGLIKSDIYPYKKPLEDLRKFPDIWNNYLNKMLNIPFYSKMSKSELEEWLSKYQEDEHKKLEKINGVSINLLQVHHLFKKK